MITNKCFLYIDGYPRHASDIPFDIAIDWGDGSDVEEYFRLHVEKIPPFTHLYQDTQPRNIQVTLLKHSCSAESNRLTKSITYIPFNPESLQRKCENSVNSLPGVQVASYFSEVVRLADGSVSATLVTDVSTSPDMPLIKFLKKGETIETEYDSPIFVSLELTSVQSVQESVCYYINEDGRHHCISINVLQFTQTAFSNLQNARGMNLTINLDTGSGPISGVCSGTINHNCLQNAIQ
jgi:hypothetical protein